MNVIITGCSKGIGFETLKAFAYSNQVKNIIAVSRGQIGNIENVMTSIFRLNLNINEWNNHYKITELLQKSNLKIDILINNAGYLINKPISTQTDEEIDMQYKTNAVSPLILIKGLLPYFNQNSQIVNITSMGGVLNATKFPGLAPYSSSKAALNILTECLAIEPGFEKIRVNALALGAVNTEMLSQAFPNYKATVNPDTMGEFIKDFCFNQSQLVDGQVFNIAMANPQ